MEDGRQILYALEKVGVKDMSVHLWKGGTCFMENWMFFLQKYQEILIKGAVILIGLIAMLLLIGILRQIKKLNKGFRNITENIQAYFDVILREEEEEEEKLASAQVHSERNEEKKESLDKEHKKMEDEKLVNAVLQEYFS